MQTSPSHSTASKNSEIHSTTIIIHLVNPEQDKSLHIKQYRKPHISLTNFEDLIKPTPFKKFRPILNSSPQIVFRSNSSPVADTNNPDFGKINLALRKIRSTQSSPTKSKATRTYSRQGSPVPKSRFALESQRNIEDLSP